MCAQRVAPSRRIRPDKSIRWIVGNRAQQRRTVVEINACYIIRIGGGVRSYGNVRWRDKESAGDRVGDADGGQKPACIEEKPAYDCRRTTGTGDADLQVAFHV